MVKQNFLFEISWEVCNKVGGIYTVLRTKMKQAVKNFSNNYVLIGPLHDQNKFFIEKASPFLDEAQRILAAKGINCHVGYWDTEGQPAVILIDYKQHRKIEALLYELWTDFGVDSLASNYDYQEPILFSTAAGEAIAALNEGLLAKDYQVVAHFHEWLCGAGLLYLKKNSAKIATVFTTHATVLGRALASDNKLVFNLPKNFDPTLDAKQHGVFAKHSLECAAAREADCFTTVSNITADEANIILDKYPDKIVPNGLDVEHTQQVVAATNVAKVREKLLQVANQVTGKNIASDAKFWVTSGRYEFHNKGYDVLLKSLAQLENKLPKNSPPIVVFFLIAASWHNKGDGVLAANPDHDSIVQLIRLLNLNRQDSKISVVYADAYLNGADGVFDYPYAQIISACDLTIFPSFYEPWGYTPLESIALSTPTVTTDLAGFGSWVESLEQDYQGAVCVLKRKDTTDPQIIEALCEQCLSIAQTVADESSTQIIHAKSYNIALLADWKNFYNEYLDAYTQAIRFNELSQLKLNLIAAEDESATIINDAEVVVPRFRRLQYECLLPTKLEGLRALAYNFWWSWHDEAKMLFQKIDPVLWQKTHQNPVYFLNLVSTQTLQKIADDKEYLLLYNKVIDAFNNYNNSKSAVRLCGAESITPQYPIAYFCMEYGIDEWLPIYSGGLGILAGDYLKVMSDLGIPLVAVGLFYKRGYFRQTINASGEQEAEYETWDQNQIPMQPVNDASGKILLTTIGMSDRTVYVRAWEARIGRVSLYLLDSDVSENSPEDRKITNSLYGGTKEVRLMQEKILGIGGSRFLVEKLGVTPAIYHLNEGHSAFLLLERVRRYCHQGYSFDAACEAVRCSTVFTTHTPVAAGNEVFSEDLIKKYFVGYAEAMGITNDKLLALAQGVDPQVKGFSMTVLALRLSLNANAVSILHGKVARNMWQGVWPGFLPFEIPIDVITNGVHVDTWLGSSVRQFYDKISSVSNSVLWKAHQEQKEKLLNKAKELIVNEYEFRKESKHLINSSLQCLDNNTLVVGISRRFTAYKRNDLFLRDKERLAKILNDAKKPIVILVAGKAHPDDSMGKELIREVIETLRQDIFNGHIIFLEEYNIALAKLLVQGVDVWLNTPILGREACGTSGMKVGINGGLNFSTCDGWWDEAYDSKIGWKIESLPQVADIEKRNDLENRLLLDKLESEIVPLYYNKNRSGFNPEWVDKIKNSITLISSQYGAVRMVRDYVSNMYCSTALRCEQLLKDDQADLRSLVAWKQDVAERFNTVKIKTILVNGVKDGKITSQGMLKVRLLLFSGKMSVKELKVEMVLFKDDEQQAGEQPIIIPLRPIDSRDVGLLAYVAEYSIEDTGFYSYGIRVMPFCSMLFRQQDVGLVLWG